MLKDKTVHSPKVKGNENAENGSSGDKDEDNPQYQPNIPPRPLNSLQTASVSSIPSYTSLPAPSTKPITPAAPSVPHGPVALITSIIPSTPNNPRGLPTNESYVPKDVPTDLAASAREVQAISTAFKDSADKFNGHLYENIMDYIRQYNVVCRNLAIPNRRKFELMHNLFRDDAKERFFTNIAKSAQNKSRLKRPPSLPNFFEGQLRNPPYGRMR
jgi:hypothetical protein